MSDSRFILRKTATGEERELSGVIPVGRDAAGGLILVEDGASRRHATLGVADGAAYVEDSGSRNGTFVNDTLIAGRTVLRSGDRLRFNKEEFELRIETVSAATVMGATAPKKSHVAGAWVDWNTSGSDGTERFTPEQLAEYLRKAKQRQAQGSDAKVSEPCLTVRSGAQAGRIIPLTGTGDLQEWTIGRGADCAIRFDEGDISEWHAKIVREGGKWKVIDAISSNGSFVNDLQVGMSYLSSGDSLRFGRVECVFHLPGKASRAMDGGVSRGPMSRKALYALIVASSFCITLLALYFWIRRGR